MPPLQDFLTPIDVSLDQLLLDPNNPRFAELGEPVDIVPETRIAEPRVKRDTYERMKSQRFDVAELRDTIKTIGYLPMDRIVVRKWRHSPESSQLFVVVEGNRRVAALNWLMELHDTGRETFSPAQIDNFKRLPALLLDDTRAPESARWVLPGLRHVSGIKEWGPYQKARAVFVLRDSGASPQEAGQSLGLSTLAANRLWRSYLALEQMRQDEEYGEFAEPKMYSYFEEVIKRSNLRDWLGWSDSDRKFTKGNNLREFYSWVVGDIAEGGERAEAKLPEARSVRDLSLFINDEPALAIFRSPGGTLARALARYEAEHKEPWQGSIAAAETTLVSLTPDALRVMGEDDVARLEALRQRIERVLEDRRRLQAGEDG